MLNRLTAVAANVELLGERAVTENASAQLCSDIEAIRGQLTETARDACALVDGISAHLSSAAAADLGLALRDTLAPLRRHLERRRTILIAPEIPHGVSVAIEPELLRAAIAAALDAVLASAIASDVVRITHHLTDGREIVTFVLETREHAAELSNLDGELASLGAWLEVRGGALRQRHERHNLVVSLELPSAVPEGLC